MVIDAGRPSGQPGEKWGGYVAASRSPSGAADGVAARAATPPGGVDRDNSSSRAIASASASIARAATWPPIARYVQRSEHACVSASRTGVRHCGHAGTA